MFPLSDESLSLSKIAGHWSRGSRGSLTETEAVNRLLAAFWLNELEVAIAEMSDVRGHILQFLMNRSDQPGFIITSEPDNRHPDEIELHDGEIWCGWRLHVSNINGHQTAFEKLSQTDISSYSDALKVILYSMTVTKVDFLQWCNRSGYRTPSFWSAKATAQTAKAHSESKLKNWLENRFAHPPWGIKADVRASAKLEFPGLSQRAFDRAWRETRPEHGRSGGRPRKPRIR